MMTGETSSGRGSDTTLSSMRRDTASDREADLLAREAKAAQAAVLEAIGDLKSGLSTAADPRLWAQQHPWAAIGVAAAAGFAAAALLVPSSDQKLKDKLSDILGAVSPTHKADTNGDVKVEPRDRSGPMAMVMESLIDLVKTAVTSFVVGAVHKSADTPETEQAPNAGAPESELNSAQSDTGRQ